MQTIPFQVLNVVLLIWVLFWKGLALWRAAQSKQTYWFVALLVLGTFTVSILELLYLTRFAKDKLTLKEMKTWPDKLTRRKSRN